MHGRELSPVVCIGGARLQQRLEHGHGLLERTLLKACRQQQLAPLDRWVRCKPQRGLELVRRRRPALQSIQCESAQHAHLGVVLRPWRSVERRERGVVGLELDLNAREVAGELGAVRSRQHVRVERRGEGVGCVRQAVQTDVDVSKHPCHDRALVRIAGNARAELREPRAGVIESPRLECLVGGLECTPGRIAQRRGLSSRRGGEPRTQHQQQ